MFAAVCVGPGRHSKKSRRVYEKSDLQLCVDVLSCAVPCGSCAIRRQHETRQHEARRYEARPDERSDEERRDEKGQEVQEDQARQDEEGRHEERRQHEARRQYETKLAQYLFHRTKRKHLKKSVGCNGSATHVGHSSKATIRLPELKGSKDFRILPGHIFKNRRSLRAVLTRGT